MHDPTAKPPKPGWLFSFQKKKRSQMVLSIKMKWPYIIIVLINAEARIWNKVLSKCCQNAFFAKKLRFVSAQEKEKALSLGLFYGTSSDN